MITLTTEQAQQIEEALVATLKNNDYWLEKCTGALDTIRAARTQEQAEQEPVAWVWLDDWLNDGYPEDCFSRVNHQGKAALYAAPVRTKDLTDDEIEEIGKSYFDEWSFGFARAVIAAHKEKQND